MLEAASALPGRIFLRSPNNENRPGTCLACMKRVDGDGQQPGTKSARGLAEKPQINCGSTAGFVPPTVYIKYFICPCLRRHAQEHSPRYHWGLEGRLAFGTIELSAPCSARPRPALLPVHRADPTQSSFQSSTQGHRSLRVVRLESRGQHTSAPLQSASCTANYAGEHTEQDQYAATRAGFLDSCF